MPEHVRHGEETVNPQTHRETSDVNARALMWFMVVFLIVAAASHVLIWLFYRYLREQDRVQSAPPLTAVARPAGINTPPQPRLQPFPDKGPEGQVEPPYTTTPVMDLNQMRAAEDQALNTPGWIDQKQGIVRVPIDIAKKLVVEQGLPVVENKQ